MAERRRAVGPARYAPRGTTMVLRAGRRILKPLDSFGFVLGFVGQALGSIPLTLRRYRSQTMAMITDLTWGRGSLIVGGGTVPVLMVLGIAMGVGTAIQAFAALDMLGLGPLTGIVSAFANTRELAPIAAAVGFAAQAGGRMTAEIGSMRISEEVDAIEALALRSVPFVVTTRLIAGVVTIVPCFVVALLLSYASASTLVLILHGQSSGVYNHYFNQLLNGWDIVAAAIKVLVFIVAVILIHCYQGFFASGGPEGVGIASGRAVRASFIVIITLDMVLSIMFWGIDSPIAFPG
ncbi:MlaE family ABC transporter permease [Mycobacteroides chelonae]|uniref:ABC transporter permease n=1 Tax=Mycobacteroides chelonae TaxID=1774 RepID=A0A1S1M3I3_MYCCH|nr:ABC transporter permease [Mycobacteroides chelonae]OHU53265.1 ABC transporter permease [Mycobacteroides chelonae]OHU78181.1 ABC transporter permease [Mycobacteroides chelonae]QQG86634.1 ABC transporter permease [Mycobacteroides chelonae]QQG91451.1 ABC transporter permease [Mycobacteroides chelonae]